MKAMMRMVKLDVQANYGMRMKAVESRHGGQVSDAILESGVRAALVLAAQSSLGPRRQKRKTQGIRFG